MKKKLFKEYYQKNAQAFRPEDLRAKKKEIKIAAELARIIGAQTEYPAGYGLGRIDIISGDWLIEVKYAGDVTSAKHLIGQLLCYSYSLNWRAKLGAGFITNKSIPPGILLFCKQYNIHVFLYNLNLAQWEYYDNF